MAIFWKKHTLRFGWNWHKIFFWTNYHDEIGFGADIHEKFLRRQNWDFWSCSHATGMKGATDQILPWKASNDLKSLPTCITHNYMSFWPTLGPYKYPQGPKRPFGGPRGPRRALEVLKRPQGHNLVPTVTDWSNWVGNMDVMCSGTSTGTPGPPNFRLNMGMRGVQRGATVCPFYPYVTAQVFRPL